MPKLQYESTLGGCLSCLGQSFGCGTGVPHGQHRIAGKLDHITTMLMDDFDELAEVVVQMLSEYLCARWPLDSKLLGKCGKPGDIREQHGCRKGLRTGS
jgi:hypothetical protein